MGFGDTFINQNDDDLTDDHVFVNDIAGIRTIDSINRQVVLRNGVPLMNNQENRPERRFAYYWHTHQDNMVVISRQTLRTVGTVLLSVLYREAAL